ncbi:MAG: hypothetical protein RL180_111 [Pseudomonadota bacterium]|jgi:DNA-binding transcriptional ArsR family regulator
MDVDLIIKALANPVRRDILAWLKTPEVYFPDQALPLSFGVCAGQIDQRAGLSQSTISTHLAVLQRAGLINAQKIGQWHFFKRDDLLIQAFLTEMQQRL